MEKYCKKCEEVTIRAEREHLNVGHCIVCYNKYQVEYRKKNKEKLNTYVREVYYPKHREKLLAKQRKVRKQWADLFVEWGYGKCSECGYDKCFAAIELHHVDPTSKDIAVSKLTTTRHLTKENIDKVKGELSKCIPLCANCHRCLHFEGD